MKSVLKLKPKAQKDFEKIWDYTAEKWSEQQAKKYISDMHDQLTHLSKNSNIGRSAEDVREGYFRFLIGRHVVF